MSSKTLQQTMLQSPNDNAGEWNRIRPFAPPSDEGLSGRAKNIYGWIAGIYAFSVPWSDFLLLPYRVQFTRPLVALAILSWLVSWRSHNNVRRLHFPLCAMLLFVVMVPLHLITADNPERTSRRVLSYLGLFLMAMFFHQAIRTWQVYRFVLRCFVAGCSVPLIGLAWNLLTGVAQGDGRYTAPGYDPNDLAGQIALSIPVASYLAFSLTEGAIWYRLYLPFAVAGILLTASRAGVLVLMLVSIHPALCLLRNTRRGKIGLLLCIACTAAAVYYVSPNISFHRLATLTDEVSRGDMNGRGAIWSNGIRLFWEHPIVGIGAGAFAATASGRFNTVAHNTYIGILVEHGLIGLVVFLSIVGGLLVRTRKLPPDERLLWRMVLLAWMVLVSTLSWENREFTWLVWALCGSYVAMPVKSGTLLSKGTALRGVGRAA